MRKGPTPAEKILWKSLRGSRFADLKFRRQHIIGRHIVDFYCAQAELVVEIDGQTHIGREKIDADRTHEIEKFGVKVIRFWNSTVYDDLQSVMQSIWNEAHEQLAKKRERDATVPLSPPGRGVRGEGRARVTSERHRTTRENPSPPAPLPGGERGERPSILYSDASIIAVNKPPGISVHDAPGPGVSLLRRLREEHGLSDLVPIHRLDKDASGILLFSRNKNAAAQIQRRWDEVQKTYVVLVEGKPPLNEGCIDAPILENQTGKPERLERALKYYRLHNPGVEMPALPAPKTSAVHPAGRASQTDYRLLEAFTLPPGVWSLLEISPRQGRMHQIRVHLKHIGCPLAIDPLYGKAVSEFPKSEDGASVLNRLPLHAAKLVVPYEGKMRAFEAPLPDDISVALSFLRGTSK